MKNQTCVGRNQGLLMVMGLIFVSLQLPSASAAEGSTTEGRPLVDCYVRGYESLNESSVSCYHNVGTAPDCPFRKRFVFSSKFTLPSDATDINITAEGEASTENLSFTHETSDSFVRWAVRLNKKKLHLSFPVQERWRRDDKGTPKFIIKEKFAKDDPTKAAEMERNLPQGYPRPMDYFKIDRFPLKPGVNKILVAQTPQVVRAFQGFPGIIFVYNRYHGSVLTLSGSYKASSCNHSFRSTTPLSLGGGISWGRRISWRHTVGECGSPFRLCSFRD